MPHREIQAPSELTGEIFDTASDLAPEMRAAFLDARLCPSNESNLRVRHEVERLLRYHDSSGILDQKPIELANEAERSAALEPGDLIATRFRIVRMIGSGGMGEVYEAEDATTGQFLALKTIRPGIAEDAEHATRFRQELLIARNIAHRNVCKVFEYDDVAHGAGGRLRFYTMELLRGETLADRLAAQGRVRPDQALAILEQIASGLEEVHRSGIIHRDLKPSNIFLVGESDGSERVVVMDFGLARNISGANARHTQTDMMMGTRLYMAPELPKAAGISSDIYSFGVVALEMVTGSASPIVAPRSRVPSLDPAWDKTLLLCLNLDPGKRPNRVGDAMALLRRRTRPWRIALVAAAGVVVSAGAVAGGWSRINPAPAAARAATQITFDSGFTVNPATSADGKLLAYASDRNSPGDLNIWLQNLDSGETRQMSTDPYDEDEPALSPDGKFIAWRSLKDDALYVRPTAEGAPRKIAQPAFDPRFSPDGRNIAYWTGVDGQRNIRGRVWYVPVEGGAPVNLARGFADARLPAWSPDGKTLIFRGTRQMARSLDDVRDWWITSLNGRSVRPTGMGSRIRAASLEYHDSPVLWDGSNMIFAARAGHGINLWSMRFLPFLNTPIGSPLPLTSGAGLQSGPALLNDSRIAFTDWRERVHLFRLDPGSGALRQITNQQSIDTRVSVSADGRTLVFGRRLGMVRNIWTKDLRTGVERELAANELAIPFVSPDGRTAAISSGPAIRLIDVASARQSLACSDCGELRGWMASSPELLYLSDAPGTPPAIRLLDLSTKSKSTLLSAPGLDEAAVSPDGKTLAFTIRSESMYSVIYIARLTAGGVSGAWTPITPAGHWADKPIWSPDGMHLYFNGRLDGFQCIWNQELDPARLRPIGEPRETGRFHQAAKTLSHLSPSTFGLGLGGGGLFLSVSLSESNIWAVHP